MMRFFGTGQNKKDQSQERERLLADRSGGEENVYSEPINNQELLEMTKLELDSETVNKDLSLIPHSDTIIKNSYDELGVPILVMASISLKSLLTAALDKQPPVPFLHLFVGMQKKDIRFTAQYNQLKKYFPALATLLALANEGHPFFIESPALTRYRKDLIDTLLKQAEYHISSQTVASRAGTISSQSSDIVLYGESHGDDTTRVAVIDAITQKTLTPKKIYFEQFSTAIDQKILDDFNGRSFDPSLNGQALINSLFSIPLQNLLVTLSCCADKKSLSNIDQHPWVKLFVICRENNIKMYGIDNEVLSTAQLEIALQVNREGMTIKIPRALLLNYYIFNQLQPISSQPHLLLIVGGAHANSEYKQVPSLSFILNVKAIELGGQPAQSVSFVAKKALGAIETLQKSNQLQQRQEDASFDSTRDSRFDGFSSQTHKRS